MKGLLSASPPKGTNFGISSHANPFHALAGPPYLAEGEIAVIQPKGRKGVEVIARIGPADWERLAP